MPSFSLVIEYLTGYAVATDPANRERAEWPPHPARIFMALAAAHFETDGSPEEKQAEREALELLATLPPPDMRIPEHSPRDVVQEFVPVNDMELPSLKTIDGWDMSKKEDIKACRHNMLIPAYRVTNRKERFFPRVHVGSEPLRLTWGLPEDRSDNYLNALESICRNVTRIGHSSSLVWARVERDSSIASVAPTHVPDETGLGIKLRTPFPTMLQSLRDDYGQDARNVFEQLHAEDKRLQEQIEQLESDRKQIKGKDAKARKLPYDEQIESKKTERTGLAERLKNGPPAPIRPRISHAASYSPVTPKHELGETTIFDPNFIILREAHDAPQTFGLESTAAITHALRGLLMSEPKAQPVPSWVSGHEPDGRKLESGHHLALIPLAFIGRPWVNVEQYADGHLMGIGIVLPRSVPLRDRAKQLAPILFNTSTNTPSTLDLTMGRAGVWKLVRETDSLPRQTLRTETYTAANTMWASVTPVLLDRIPKTERVKDPIAWREEVADIVARSCNNIGLPDPITVRVEKTPFFRGSLRAMPGQGGFPQLRKDKHQVHVIIEFDRPVQGPVLIGAGRFRGYGLMRPWKNEEGA